MLKSMIQSRLNAYLEGTMKEFAQGLDKGRASRAMHLQHLFTGLTRGPAGDAVLQWHVPSQSDPSTVYECYVSIQPKGMSLFAVANNVRDLRSRVLALKNADVKCFCPCKDFQYSGAAYNMKHLDDGFAEGHGNAGADIPPDVRDPNRRMRLCKHLAAVFKGVLTNAGTIMKQAKEAKFEKEEPEKVDLGPLSKQPKKETPVEETPDVISKNPETPVGETPSVIPENVNVKSDPEAIPKMEGLNPVKTPEIKESLDALAGTLEGAAETGDNGTEQSPVPEEEDNDMEENGEVPEMPGLNPTPQNDNLMYGLEDAVNDPMFNPPDED